LNFKRLRTLCYFSANIVYKPYEEDTLFLLLNKRDKFIRYGGVMISNCIMPKYGTKQININFEYNSILFRFYDYSFSNIFQIELLNIGSFSDINLGVNKIKIYIPPTSKKIITITDYLGNY
tara:strand:+ start:440 stop:802 length:363 start_codon:yes stop_codon:yes gene_type:complete